MRRLAIYICICMGMTLVMTGCTDNSYKGMMDEVIYEDNSLPIPVKIHIGTTESIISKGDGDIDDLMSWAGREFRVYAFSKDMFTSMETRSCEDRARCLIDGSVDDKNDLGGKAAVMSEVSSLVEWQGNETEIFYPTASQSGVIYDFFAYYVDDAKVHDVYRGTETIDLRLEIDGTQDIMSSVAQVRDEQLAGFMDEKDRLYMEHYCYSYYSAQHGIDPVFTFRHHLAKLEFTITPAYNTTGRKDVMLKSIDVESLYLAMFTVASKNGNESLGLLFDNEKEEGGVGGYRRLSLREADGSTLSDSTYTVQTLSTPDSKPKSMKVGGCIMVAPDREYDLYLMMSEKEVGGNDLTQAEPMRLHITAPDGFKAGNSYKVDLKIYGSMRVETSVEIMDWKEGEDIIVDEDER